MGLIGARPLVRRAQWWYLDMTWIASLTKLSERELDRLIKRIGAILLVGALIFVAFYLFDRWRPTAPSIVDRSITSLEAAVRANPEDIAARGRLADAYVLKARYADAITEYEAILSTGKMDEFAHFGRAGAYQALGNLDGAKADYQAVIDIASGGEMANVDPMLNASYYGLGAIALEQDKPPEAIRQLSAAIAIIRSDADALNLLGTAYLRNGEPAKAIEPLRSAIAFVPIGWSEPYATLAQAYQDTGDPARAAWATAMADLSKKDYTSAETGLKAILDGPAVLEATVGLGLVNEMRGDGPAAAEWYGKALAIDPQSTEAKLGLSRVAVPTESGEGVAP